MWRCNDDEPQPRSTHGSHPHICMHIFFMYVWLLQLMSAMNPRHNRHPAPNDNIHILCGAMMHAVIYTSQGTSTKLWYVYISSSSTFLFGAAHHAHVSIDPANDWSRQRQNIHSFNDFIYNNFHARNNLRNWYRLSGAWCAAVYIEEWRDCWPHRFYPWHHTKYVCVCVCGSTKYQHIHAA